jgi:hypothetical protein
MDRGLPGLLTTSEAELCIELSCCFGCLHRARSSYYPDRPVGPSDRERDRDRASDRRDAERCTLLETAHNCHPALENKVCIRKSLKDSLYSDVDENRRPDGCEQVGEAKRDIIVIYACHSASQQEGEGHPRIQLAARCSGGWPFTPSTCKSDLQAAFPVPHDALGKLALLSAVQALLLMFHVHSMLVVRELHHCLVLYTGHLVTHSYVHGTLIAALMRHHPIAGVARQAPGFVARGQGSAAAAGRAAVAWTPPGGRVGARHVQRCARGPAAPRPGEDG